MTRAALLPTVADPCLLRWWLDYYEHVWCHEVDRLYVQLNTSPNMTPASLEACRQMLAAAPHTTVLETLNIDHGHAIASLVRNCTEDLVGLFEDDAPVIRAGEVDRIFRIIERKEADMLGVSRGSCSDVITVATIQKYGSEGVFGAESGANWWPCFFFGRRTDLLRTDMNFSATGWAIGDRIEQLDLTFSEIGAGDTFVWTSIQLRAMGLHHQPLLGNHSYNEDLHYRDRGEHLWSPACCWIHIGSLSGISGLSGDGYNMTGDPDLHRITTQSVRDHYCELPDTLREILRRLAWLRVVFIRTHDRLRPQLGAAIDHYEQNLNCEIEEYLSVLTPADHLQFQQRVDAYLALLPDPITTNHS